MSYVPAQDRYTVANFRRCGRSGLQLPAISLGLWQNFGGTDVFETGRAIVRRAFDRGVTHFDLANNYGPPFGSTEENFGAILKKDFADYRDEMIVSTKAGWPMWEGPYGVGGSRKYVIASLDQSLKRLGLDYVDIFYAHRPWPDTPVEETAAALAQAVRQGKALYVGISSHSPARTRLMEAALRAEGVKLLIHQPSYSMFNRWIETDGLMDTLDELGVGCIGFSPLAQGLLTDKYIHQEPAGDARAAKGGSFRSSLLTPENLANVRALNAIAQRRGQTLAQMAVAWTLRDKRFTSALVGARTVEQLDDSLDALKNLSFSPEDLAEIDTYAVEGGVDLWRAVSRFQ
ncbi:MAG: L-glyceraldehyde 3-phosphate reductase [Ancalomicrobiaceae bacterium]|nr:L-glyceraldehyde 3-phosphate reductase [Ancalomicrobiaceae bacterium]